MIKRSDSTKLLIAALGQFQAEVTPVPKTSTNPFFKSKYADLPTVVEHTRRLLTKHGLLITQLPGDNGDSPTLITMLAHVSGEWMEAETPLMLAKEDPQAQGSAITYMRRYAYCAVLGIVADDDDDAESAMRRPSQQVQPAQAGTFTPDPAHTTYETINGEQIPTGTDEMGEITRTGPPTDLPTDKQRNFAKALLTGLVGAGPQQDAKLFEWFKDNGLRWNGSWNNISRNDAKYIIENLKKN